MNRNLKLVINNSIKKYEEKFFFEKSELKIILDYMQKWFRTVLGKIMALIFRTNK